VARWPSSPATSTPPLRRPGDVDREGTEDKLDEEVAALDCFDPDDIEALWESRIQQTTSPARFGTPLVN
jgi:hypothetical protein